MLEASSTNKPVAIAGCNREGESEDEGSEGVGSEDGKCGGSM